MLSEQGAAPLFIGAGIIRFILFLERMLEMRKQTVIDYNTGQISELDELLTVVADTKSLDRNGMKVSADTTLGELAEQCSSLGVKLRHAMTVVDIDG